MLLCCFIVLCDGALVPIIVQWPENLHSIRIQVLISHQFHEKMTKLSRAHTLHANPTNELGSAP